MKLKVSVSLKPGVLDPQGQAIGQALVGLGYENIGHVRVGKVIIVEVEAKNEKEARAQLDEMCRRLLVNQVMETYHIEIVN